MPQAVEEVETYCGDNAVRGCVELRITSGSIFRSEGNWRFKSMRPVPQQRDINFAGDATRRPCKNSQSTSLGLRPSLTTHPTRVLGAVSMLPRDW